MDDRREADVEFKTIVLAELKQIKQDMEATKKISEDNTKKLNEWTVWIRAVRYLGGLLALIITMQWDKIIKYLGS